ncbi:unnamed protein product [Rotaria socialis]|uniref:Uncharacterized protein n=1 Tax=Rotaria socialis TaxID=392032 RepID=A0A818MY00_9BILA|nr:unnamed protein product [Rotaria socialis]
MTQLKQFLFLNSLIAIFLGIQNNTLQVIDATDCSSPKLITKTSSNRVAAWRAQRNARESDASRLIRLDSESGAKATQRKKHSRLTSITEHCNSFENKADNNKNETGNQKMNEARSLEEGQKQRKTTLYYKVPYKLSDWCTQGLLANEKIANIELTYERKHQNTVRRVRSLLEREGKFGNSSNHEVFSMLIQRCNRKDGGGYASKNGPIWKP